MSKYRNQSMKEEEEEEEEDFEELYDDFSPAVSGESDGESCSSDLGDDAASNQNQPLISQNSSSVYELSSLMGHLPLKRGLSKYYDGKSQSFSSLSEVKCKEDLPKKENPFYKRKIKPCKSYACGLSEEDPNANCGYNPTNKNIAKKPSRGSCGNLMAQSNNNINFICRPPPIPLNKSSRRLS